MGSPEYAAAWQRFRVRAWLANGSGAGLLLLMVFHLAWSDPWGVPAGVALLFVTAVWRNYWRCPRCSRPYFTNGALVVACAHRCLHCGLPRWSADPDAR